MIGLKKSAKPVGENHQRDRRRDQPQAVLRLTLERSWYAEGMIQQQTAQSPDQRSSRHAQAYQQQIGIPENAWDFAVITRGEALGHQPRDGASQTEVEERQVAD